MSKSKKGSSITSKRKKGSAITPDKPVDSRSIMNEIEQGKENRTNEEIWTLNRELEIGVTVTIAEMRAQRHSPGDIAKYIEDEDKIVERILEAPLPLNNYVDFYDLSDRGSAYLTTFCTRLAVRRMTLNFERKRVESSPWSDGKDAKIKLIDGAIKLVEFVLNAPTSDKDTIEAQIANYKNLIGLPSSIVEVAERASGDSKEDIVFNQTSSLKSQKALRSFYDNEVKIWKEIEFNLLKTSQKPPVAREMVVKVRKELLERAKAKSWDNTRINVKSEETIRKDYREFSKENPR